MDKLKNVYFHGELIIREVEEFTTSDLGKKLDTKNDVKVGDSETTGNFHMLQSNPGVTTFFNEDLEKFFVSVKDETKVYCKLESRHTDLQLLTGKYEISIAQEFDHITKRRRNVLD